jgi:hypothetical protein
VASTSKITFFIFLIVLAVNLSSCNKNNDVIPDVYVDFSIDISDPRFVNLNALGGTVIVNANTNNQPYSGGFDNNGILIHAGVNDEFYAYDRTCPYDYVVKGLSIEVNIDPVSSLNAVCPQCSTYYALPAGGTPFDGTGQYPLKNYKTSFNGRLIRVWNK